MAVNKSHHRLFLIFIRSYYQRQTFLTNIAATQLIKQLYTKQSVHSKDTNDLFYESMSIYEGISEEKNEYTLNSMLSLFLRIKQPHKISKIWSDIDKISSSKPHCSISYILILRCLLYSKDTVCADQIIQTLEWMKAKNCKQSFEGKEYSKIVSRVIYKFNADKDTLKKIHSLIVSLPSFANDIFVKTALMNGYEKYFDYAQIEQIFDSIPNDQKDEICTSTMMKMWINNDENEKVLSLYDEMLCTADGVIHSLAIKACTKTKNVKKGKMIHCKVRNASIEVKNALISFYGHFGDVLTAQNIFYSLSENEKNVISVGAMMTAFIENGQYENALTVYDDNNDSHKNDICHLLAIKACTKTNNLHKGNAIISELQCDEQSDINLINCGIDFFGNFYDVRSAQNTFKETANWRMNIGTINAMMSAFYRCNLNKQSIKIFKNMHIFQAHLSPNARTFSLVFACCAADESLFGFGQETHCNLDSEMLNDVSVQTNLIKMYAKNGQIEVCEHLFAQIKEKEVRVCNAMLFAYGSNAKLECAKHLFERMQTEFGLVPIKKSFAILFNAFAHCNDIESAHKIWSQLKQSQNDIKFDEYVITTLIDGLSRNGQLLRAYKLIRKYEKHTNNEHYNDVMWTSLLSAFVRNNHQKSAKRIYEKYKFRFGQDKKYISSMKAADVLMSNLKKE